jgi:hypothetical protein
MWEDSPESAGRQLCDDPPHKSPGLSLIRIIAR